jgi:hypothetical protein
VIAEALTAAAKFLGVADKVAAMIQASQQKAAGKNELLATQNAESAKVNEDVAKAAVSTTDDAAVELLRRGGA